MIPSVAGCEDGMFAVSLKSYGKFCADDFFGSTVWLTPGLRTLW